MKILQVSTISTTLEAFLIPYAQAFKRLGWRVDAAANNINDNYKVVQSHDNCFELSFCRNPFRVVSLFRSLAQVRRLLRAEQYDIVHVHTPIASFLTRIATIGIVDTKVFYTAHGFHYIDSNPFWKNTIFYLIEKIVGKTTDHLFVINNDDYNFAVNKRILSKERITLLPGIGVDPGKYVYSSYKRKAVREEFGFGDQTFVILQVAELNVNKNHQTVIEALKLFKLLNPSSDFKFLMVGSGGMKSEIENRVIGAGLREHVMFLGQRDDIPDLLSACDVVTLSSLREGLPRCLLEAMSVGRPIIASNIRGCKDLLSSDAGVLVEPKNSQQWAKAIQSVYLSPNQAKMMADKGRELIINRYQEKKVVPLVVDVYLKEIASD